MAGQDRGVDGRHDALERLGDDQAVQVEVGRGSGPVAIVVRAERGSTAGAGRRFDPDGGSLTLASRASTTTLRLPIRTRRRPR